MATQPAVADYPLRFDVAYPEHPSRFMILIRWLLALPHAIVLGFLVLIAEIAVFLTWWAIRFTGRYPEGLFNFVVGVLRWNTNVTAYMLFYDQYPPFAMGPGEYEGVTYEIERQDSYSRLLIFVRWLLVIPHLIIIYALEVIGYIAVLALVIAVLVTGRYPRGIFDFLVGIGRWANRANAYSFMLTDRYPPFSMS